MKRLSPVEITCSLLPPHNSYICIYWTWLICIPMLDTLIDTLSLGVLVDETAETCRNGLQPLLCRLWIRAQINALQCIACKTRLIHKRDITHSYMAWHIDVWHDPFTRDMALWRVVCEGRRDVCAPTYRLECMQHASFYVAMTHSYVFQYAYLYTHAH